MLVLTAQNRQARVQVSPMIMMVAVAVPSLPPQHSPMFGQRASSHTVARPRERTFDLIVSYSGEEGGRGIDSQEGFLSFLGFLFFLVVGASILPSGPLLPSTLPFSMNSSMLASSDASCSRREDNRERGWEEKCRDWEKPPDEHIGREEEEDLITRDRPILLIKLTVRRLIVADKSSLL